MLPHTVCTVFYFNPCNAILLKISEVRLWINVLLYSGWTQCSDLFYSDRHLGLIVSERVSLVTFQLHFLKLNVICDFMSLSGIHRIYIDCDLLYYKVFNKFKTEVIRKSSSITESECLLTITSAVDDYL